MICSKCGLPEELCVCEKIAKETQKIEVYSENRKQRKIYTIITGIETKEIDMKELVKKLKSRLACGGTVKDGKIELQGYHIHKIKVVLRDLGFALERINIK